MPDEPKKNTDTKVLEEQIKALKAELALRSESTKELFNSKNESTNSRITSFITYFTIALTAFASIIGVLVFSADKFGEPIITKWAEDNVAKFAEERFQSKLDNFERNLDDKLDNLGVNLDFMDWYQQGELEYENRELASAVKSFTHAIRMEPNHVYANGVRGISYARLGKYKKAIIDLDKAIGIKPDYAIAYGYKGISHYFLKEYVTAFKNINKETDLFIERDDYDLASDNITATLSRLDKTEIDEKFSKEMKKAIKGDIEQLQKQLEDARNKKELFKKESQNEN